MRFAVFRQEEFFERYEFACDLMLALSGVLPMNEGELDELVRGMIDPKAEVGYTPSAGFPELRRAIAGLYPGAKEENVLVTVGAIEALLSLQSLLLDKGDELVCLFPSYQPLHEHARGMGADVRFVRLEEEKGFAIDLDAVLDAVTDRTRVVLLNVPHNPTGQTLSEGDLRTVASRLEKRGATLIVDEVFREMRGGAGPSAWSGAGNLVVVGSMSKAYGLPGLRVGWFVGSEELVVEGRRFRKYTSLNPGSRDQLTALAALGRRDVVLERSARLTEHGVRAADAWFDRYGGVFSLVRPKGGGLYFPRLKKEMPTERFCDELVRDTGVLLAPGSACYDMEGFLRMGVATNRIDEGLDRIGAWLDKRGWR